MEATDADKPLNNAQNSPNHKELFTLKMSISNTWKTLMCIRGYKGIEVDWIADGLFLSHSR